MAKKEVKGEQMVDEVEVAVDKTSLFFEKNKSLLMGIVIAIVVLVGGYFAVKYLFVAPRERKAQTEMFFAQRYFEMDSTAMALDGDATHPGMLEIADSYKMTKSGRLAHYYAGLIYLHNGEFDNAAAHLSKFKTKDPLLYILSHQALGDAYLELEENHKALAAYKKAAGKYQNEITTPGVLTRIALTCEIIGDDAQALATYKKIRDEYPSSQDAQDVERKIARLSAKLGK